MVFCALRASAIAAGTLLILCSRAEATFQVPTSGICPATTTGPCLTITQNGTGLGLLSTAVGYSVEGYSATGCGVSGKSTNASGVYGNSSASSGNGVGVFGTTIYGSATRGSTGRGVIGNSGNIGVYGVTNTGQGIAGFGTLDSNLAVGVSGTAAGASGIGVWGICSDDCASSPTGYAGYFEGNVTIAGSSSTGGLFVNVGTGYKPGGGMWAGTSDARVKKDVKPFTRGMEDLERVQPVTFRYNGLGGTIDDGIDRVGVIAQDLEKVLPSMVSTRRLKLHPQDATTIDIEHVDPSDFTYLLINAVAEQQAAIERREARIAKLERARPRSSPPDLGLGLALGSLPVGLVVARYRRKGGGR
jgi:hypothetical protein